MDQIQLLFEPPVDCNGRVRNYSNRNTSGGRQNKERSMDLPNTSKTADDPNWRKPKANCHEYCDSCGCIDGDRLVCDRCPASFHLECLDPPMDSEEADTGVWYCHRCSLIIREEEDGASVNSERTDGSSRQSNLKCPSFSLPFARAQITNYIKAPRLRYTAAGPSPTSLGNSLLDLISDCETLYETSKLRSIWQMLNYATHLNPKEFDLPKDLIPGFKIPRSYKYEQERKNKGIIELDNGLIPRPIRNCYTCSKTCLTEPLLCCDYCDASFHISCLDPPLTHFPARCERWMCPNHAEIAIDAHLLKSPRLSERMALWDRINVLSDSTIKSCQFDTEFSHEAKQHILIEFLSQLKRKYQPIEAAEADFWEKCQTYQSSKRNKLTLSLSADTVNRDMEEGQMKSKVPNAIKNLYKKPLNLFIEEIDGECYRAEPEQQEFLASLLQFYKAIKSTKEVVPSSKSKIKNEEPTKLFTRSYEGLALEDMPCRATLIPRNCKGPSFRMTFKQAKIGFDLDCHLNLDLYSIDEEPKCGRVSAHHATIFFDSYSRTYELINYSEYGTLVDCVKFGIDNLDENSLELNSTELVRRVHELVKTGQDKKMASLGGNIKGGKSKAKQEKRFMMPAPRTRPLSSLDECSCKPHLPNLELKDEAEREEILKQLTKIIDEPGSESGALLRLGSIVKFGCYEFIFSIVEVDV
ncbi:PHD finger protein 12 [Cichlidogyrus casuarinus]|uniref:PHD finger protein 12 n=1 Tax=Cichlidogyrus casuarinus TaxID=1844966 RepID=A0ABD2Q786_9PLAT